MIAHTASEDDTTTVRILRALHAQGLIDDPPDSRSPRSGRCPLPGGDRQTSGGYLGFELVVQRYRTYVAGLAGRFSGSYADIDDLVQEVFVSAYTGIRSLRDPRSIRSWLRTITHRKSRRRLVRMRRQRAQTFDTVGEALEVEAPGATPEQNLLLRRLEHILGSLDPVQRKIWRLRYVEEEQLEAIAAITRLSLSTVQRKLKSAEDQVRRSLVG